MAAQLVLSALLSVASAWSVDFAPGYSNASVIDIEKVSIPGPGNLGAPKFNVTANHASSDWWYFDAVSTVPGDNTTIEIVFFNAGVIPTNNPISVQVTGTYTNGSNFDKYVEASGGATVTVDETGVRGEWRGAYGNFSSTPLEEPGLTYTIYLDAPEIGVRGSFILEGTGSPHYPCGSMEPGVTEELVPAFHWANPVPDGNPTVDLLVDGAPIQITEGFGYHDKNWANVTIEHWAQFWNWGHARFGPYSAVWFNPLDQDDVEHPHAFVHNYETGEVLLDSCLAGSSQVRQWGANATWPPTTGLGGVDGVEARFELAIGEVLVANLTKYLTTLDAVVHYRGNAKVQGGIEGGEVFEGFAHFEEFAYNIVLGGS